MMFLVIGAGLGVLAILFRLAALTRLTLPLLYGRGCVPDPCGHR